MDKLFRAKSTIEQWRILQAVVDCGSYAKAAEHLNKSQSSLNHATTKLQNQLGIQLLEVQGRKTVLTTAGVTMLRRSRQLMQDVEALENLSDTLNQGWEPEIKLAIEVLYPNNNLYQVLKNFLPKSHGSRLKISHEVISGSFDAIKQKTADLVITNIIPKGYIANTITSIEMIAVCSVHNNSFTDQEITLEQLAHNLQIVIGETGKSTEDRGWLKAEQRWTVDNFHEALAILHQDIGFCWLPTHFVQPHIKQGALRQIKLANYNKHTITLDLVIPDRDSAGPGTLLLEELFYQFHNTQKA